MANPNDNSGPDEISQVYRASRSTLIAAFVFSCLVNILMLTGPLFMLQVYDRVLSSGSVPTLVALITIVAILYAYYGFLEFLRARLMVRLGRRVEETLRGRVFDAVIAHGPGGWPQLVEVRPGFRRRDRACAAPHTRCRLAAVE